MTACPTKTLTKALFLWTSRRYGAAAENPVNQYDEIYNLQRNSVLVKICLLKAGFARTASEQAIDSIDDIKDGPFIAITVEIASHSNAT